MTDWSMDLFVSTPGGNLPLTDRIADQPLPQGPDAATPLLYYGPYLHALSRFFLENRGRRLLQTLETFTGRVTPPQEAGRAFLVSEKHGALYQVARLVIEATGSTSSFAVNVACTEEQKAFLQAEFGLLRNLHRQFGLPYLPRPILQGTTLYTSRSGESRDLDLFLTEWFDGYCEFHLSHNPREPNGLGIVIWDNEGGQCFLSPEHERTLYRQTASILTAYFDTQSFGQIYPWHHAAGDFVVNRRSGDLKVRLITARGYRALSDFPASDGAVVIAALHFLLNMSLRLRLDRLDGTGELAWADSKCLEAILDGFVQAWEAKCSDDSALPSAAQLLDLLSQFSRDEAMAFGQLALEDGMVERDETDYLAHHLPSHVDELSRLTRNRPQ